MPEGIIANSHAGLKEAHARGLSAGIEHVVYNGIDTERFRPDAAAARSARIDIGVPERALLVGHVGRATVVKDQPTLLKCFARVREDRPDAVMVCVGGGSVKLRSRLQVLAKSLGIADHLRWVPHTDNLNGLYSAIDVHVLSSVGEGFPNVVAEAMACGTPSVVTNVGEAAQIVGETGQVVPRSDPEALAKGVLRVLANTDGVAARRRIKEHFSIERMVDATETALQALVDGDAR